LTTPPLPDVPCVRIHFIWNIGAGDESGIRLYFSYSGTAPSGANCVTLATTAATAWNGEFSGLTRDTWTLNEVDVLDIATNHGASGSWTGSHAGTMTGVAIPASAAVNVEFGIARRYRGGKPRCFMVGPDQTAMASATSWEGSFVSSINTNFPIMVSDIVTDPPGSMGTLQHVNLSYYSGFTNHMNTSGRERPVPTYRATALHDNVLSYNCNARIGSQRRRLASTSA
jgi:hypothetical protein